ncbi:hypothetical protein TCDM_11750 [Trypanosoma cruzi Dm28c]|uniref:Reverse transcriptase domain-containing protein n=2 Tax=Trypanosoma cruzi TaxID=5693 RepID=V5AJ98_TRYCR|nr:hypothetical protein TCDM_11750 [Trypanosoma cruzi Dm28c]PWV03160.1 hypothetical protein C4B63_1g166 [Trypanosoma cruzi]
MLNRLPRLGPKPNVGCITTCGAAMLGYALANSTPGNNSPQLEHHKAASRDPNSSSTVWMMCRLENIYFASAFMYADALTLVASGADIHACAAVMPPALSRITTWAAEHSLKINVAKREAALFHISSHTESEEDMTDLLPGNGNLRIQSRPVRLLDTTFDLPLNFGPHASTVAKQTTPRRYQLRPVAQAGASNHNTQSFSIGYVHVVSLYYGDAIVPCLAPTRLHNMEALYRNSCKTHLGISAPTEDASVELEANLLPLRKILWLRDNIQHERHARFHDHGDLSSFIYSEPVPLSMHREAATSIPLQRDAAINGLERVCGTIGIPHNHNHALSCPTSNYSLGRRGLQ